MESRYVHPEVSGLLKKASFVDPGFKTLKYLSVIQQEEGRRYYFGRDNSVDRG